jgi:hypothetical protein
MHRPSQLQWVTVALVAAVFASLPTSFAQVLDLRGASPVTLTLNKESASEANLTFRMPDFPRQEVVNNGTRFDRFLMDDEPITGPIGWPELPAIVRYVLIPAESGVELKIEKVTSHIISGVNPFPRQPLSSIRDSYLIEAEASPETMTLVTDDGVRAVKGLWPETVVELLEPAIMRNYRLVPILFHPARYNAVTGELEVVDELEISLDYTSSSNRVNLLDNPELVTPSPVVDELISQIVVNPPAAPARDLGLRGGSILYVIGNNQNWNQINDALQPLVEWRRKMGWKVDILRIQDPSNAEGARGAIRDYYNDATVKPETVVICGDTDGNFAFGYFNHQAGANYPYESDHDFTMLAGNDVLPEVSVGRLIFDSVNRLTGIVNKTIAYESNPFMGADQARGWQKRGAVCAVDQRSGESSRDMCRWSRLVMLMNGYTRVNELYFGQQGNPPTRDFVNENFNGGQGLFIYRGYLWMGQVNPAFSFADVAQLRNGGMLPFAMIITCNTGDYGEHISDGGNGYFNESFSFHPNGGAIGAVGCAGATHTAYNNIYCTQAVHAFLNKDITGQGWVHMAGKLGLYTHYAGRGDVLHEENRNMEAWLTDFYITNLMGDPAVDLFTDVPDSLDVIRPESIRRGETRVEVNVIHHEGENPATDATVCLYKPNAFQLVRKPDAEGNVAFDLDPAWTASGRIFLTITGHNLKPVLAAYDVGRAARMFGASAFTIDDDNDGASSGNGDGEANQGETLEIEIEVSNLGSVVPEGQLSLLLHEGAGELTVEQGEAEFEAAPDSGRSVTANFVVNILPGFPSEELAPFVLEANIGDETWFSSIRVPVIGPKFDFGSIEWVEEPLTRASSAELRITIHNSSEVDAPPVHGTLISLVHTIGTAVAEADFDAIASGESGVSETAFRLTAHPFHIGGQEAALKLVLAAGNTFRDTVEFAFPVGQAVQGEPFGPDDYGYICFDNTDTTWFAVPDYEWIEIDPRHNREGDPDGVNTDLTDSGEGSDRSMSMNIPFNFQYYGEEFNQITICSNGWIAMGDCDQLNSARNRHIPGGECPPGLIAPFWDDLIIPQGSGIYTWNDTANHRFFVEWSRLRRLGPRGANEREETFQAILYDPEHHPSFTGDGDIVFQYHTAFDDTSAFADWDTRFASVGIAAPNLSTGLEYTYWNQRAPGAARIANGLAIKFTTLVEFRVGSLTGWVYDAFSGASIPGAKIYTTYGFFSETDDRGMFTIADILVDTNYTIRATKEFYNDSTITEQVITENENTYIEFGLLHPEFSPAVEFENFLMTRDSIATTNFAITNTGNGQLRFNSMYGYDLGDEEGIGRNDPSLPYRDDSDEAWDLLFMANLGDSLDNNKIQAVVYVEDHWVVAGGHTGEESNYFYLFDKEGREIDRQIQPIGSNYGFRDMEYYDGFIWAVDGSDPIVYQIMPENGDTVRTWPAVARRLRSPRTITVDPINQRFYLSAVTDNISEFEFSGDSLVETRTIPCFDPRDDQSIRKYGLAWFRDDPDQSHLYVISTNEVPPDTSKADISIYKINVETGQVRFLTDLAGLFPAAAGGRCGMSITPKWNNRVWALATIIEQGVNDYFSVLELAPNSSWITYSPKGDTLEAGDATDVEMAINTTALDTGQYQIMIDYTHNANPGQFRIPINLHVVDSLPPPPPPPPDTDTVAVSDPLAQPLKFDLYAASPNPFNQTTTIRFDLDQAALTRMRIFTLEGRQVMSLVDGRMKAGKYVTSFDASRLTSGAYICRLESGDKRAVQKLLLLK